MRLAFRILKWALLAVLLLAAVQAAWVGPNVYRAIYPSSDHDRIPPAVPVHFAHPAVLVFSKTNGFRHDDTIVAANALFRELGGQQRLSVFETENGAVFSRALLAQFRVVVFSNASGDLLSSEQRSALREFIERGGGFIALHAAGDNSHARWAWYVENVIGAHFVGHTLWPAHPAAIVHVEAPSHPAMVGLPAVWRRADEWYSFDRSVRARGFRVLATLDEGSYVRGGPGSAKLSMGADHPIIWSHCLGQGRVLYSALGHTAESYSEEPFRRLMSNSLAWAMQTTPCDPARGE